jgi:ribosomal 50S subunit-associated protein YjgA (DUF615 family)
MESWTATKQTQNSHTCSVNEQDSVHANMYSSEAEKLPLAATLGASIPTFWRQTIEGASRIPCQYLEALWRSKDPVK